MDDEVELVRYPGGVVATGDLSEVERFLVLPTSRTSAATTKSYEFKR